MKNSQQKGQLRLQWDSQTGVEEGAGSLEDPQREAQESLERAVEVYRHGTWTNGQEQQNSKP